MNIDLNCDLGESFGAYKIGPDDELLDYITSANVACGFHAGDPTTIRETVEKCVAKQIAIGAHPGLPDLLGFGRRAMAITPEEAYDMVVYQCGAVKAFAEAAGGRLHHVKPHGALYHIASQDANIAEAVAQAVRAVGSNLVLYGPSGSILVEAGARAGLSCANEAFIDRTYQPDGTLTPRSDHRALIQTADEAIKQAVTLATEGRVSTVDGTDAALKADTLCIHGDGQHALDFARKVRSALESAGVEVRASCR